MARLFIDIHLRQWENDVVVIVRDKNGNEAKLDGLIHMTPHQFILVELDTDAGIPVITVPGVLTDYHADNGHEDRQPVPMPARKVDKVDNVLVDAVTRQPVFLSPDGDVLPFEKPAADAISPIGVH